MFMFGSDEHDEQIFVRFGSAGNPITKLSIFAWKSERFGSTRFASCRVARILGGDYPSGRVNGASRATCLFPRIIF